jgi:hypothetical protein
MPSISLASFVLSNLSIISYPLFKFNKMPRIVTLCNVFALQVNYLKCSKMISEGLRGLVRLQVPVLK